ncbi:MAG: hypothetical protein ACPG47_01480 [Leucothrix sp.]
MMNLLIKKAAPVVAGFVLLGSFSTVQARPGNPSCPSGQTIQSTLNSGASWSMCWEARDKEGIVLSDVRYQAPGQSSRRVMGEMSLSQIQRNYDDGSPVRFLVTGIGLGGDNFVNLTNSECSGGQLRYSAGKPVLCERKKSAGFIYKYGTNTAVSGVDLSLLSASQMGDANYTVEWLFKENGTIQPRVGLSGRLDKTSSDSNFGWPIQQNGQVAVGFVDNYFWRMDFDLGNSSSNDVVEQITSSLNADRTRRSKSIQTITTETGRNFSPEVKRFWRVRDGSETNGFAPISYELVMLNYDHQTTGPNNEVWMTKDIYHTKYNACERFGADNSTVNGCGWGVNSYTNGESINAGDVVLWNRMSYHHLPRDEDDNVIGMRWNSFKLLPRDWHAVNPL